MLIFFKLKCIQLANVCSAMYCFWEYQESRFEANYVEDMCERQSLLGRLNNTNLPQMAFFLTTYLFNNLKSGKP